MSELKAHNINDLSLHDITNCEFYLKSEADKVIEEKDAEIARLKAIRKVHVEAIESMGAGLLQDEEENRHSKYKRCLAMASYWVAVSYQCVDDKHRQRAERHHRKWLELANKIKEAK